MAGEGEESGQNELQIQLKKMRSMVRQYIDRHNHETALFWADKTYSLSKGEPQDVYWYAQTLYLTRQYHRAAHLLKAHNIDKKYAAGRYLAARCHYEYHEYQEALDILDQPDSVIGNKGDDDVSEGIPTKHIESSVNLLRGRVYEALENRNLASECFRQALQSDVFCYEAFDSLVNHHMMTAQEERDLLDSLPFSSQCTEAEVRLLKFLYGHKLKKYSKPRNTYVTEELDELKFNQDVIVSLAENHYYNCEFRQAYKIASSMLKADPYNFQCLPLYVVILVELRNSSELFALAHELVDMYPDKAVSWFATGCYYLLVGKNDPARRYLSKATTVDKVFGPAWLAFGHSFAAENEHDQAMAAYFRASQLMRGCHLPVLYIGLEYGLTNNAKLAERFFGQALSLAPEDPFVLHEMGVVAYKNQDYKEAEKCFTSALEKIEDVCHEVMVDKWEPLLNNLGHVCRKLKMYKKAIQYHRQALVLQPENPATLSAIGYVYALTDDYHQAVDYFHKALGLRRDDTFSKAMLDYSLEYLMSEMSPCPDLPDELPEFRCDTKLITSPKVFSDSDTSDTSHRQETPDASSVTMDITLGEGSMAIDTEPDDT